MSIPALMREPRDCSTAAPARYRDMATARIALALGDHSKIIARHGKCLGRQFLANAQ